MSESKRIFILPRDVHAMMIPAGVPILLQEGTEVTLVQALGNSFTVEVYGNLARIDGKDADALGLEVHSPLDDLPETASVEDKVWAMLKTVYDPEIPVNIVDLGLIYHVEIGDHLDGGYKVTVTMTLTAPGCGMGPVIAEDARQKVYSIPNITEVSVETVFDPPWDRNMMSEEARLELGIY